MVRRADSTKRKLPRALARHNGNCFDFARLEDRILLASGNGLQGQYFSDSELSQLSLTRIDPEIDFNWGPGSYVAGGSVDQFSVRWSGEVEVDYTESFSFILNADDGARLWVDGQLLIDQFFENGINDERGQIELIAGRRYEFQLEYRELNANASIRLEWESLSQSRQVIPADHFFASEKGVVTQEIWNGISGTNLDGLLTDPRYPNLPDVVDTLAALEASSDTNDQFGQRLRGFIHAPQTGPYTFFVAADASARFSLSSGSSDTQLETVIDLEVATDERQWFETLEQRSEPLYLVAGQKYYFEALHKEDVGADHWRLAGFVQANSTSKSFPVNLFLPSCPKFKSLPTFQTRPKIPRLQLILPSLVGEPH